MQRRMAVLLLLVAWGCGSEPTAPEPVEPAAMPASAVVGSWVARAQYPVNISDAASASITDAAGRTTMYVIGGRPKCCGDGQITTAVKAYNGATNTWKARAHLPVPLRSTSGAAVVDGKIYVSGGFSRQWDESRQVWRLKSMQTLYAYDPGTNTWARKRDMPVTAVNGASVGHQGKLYVAVGGVVWRYDPATNQ